MCFHKQIFWRFSLGLIFGYSKILIICCGFIAKISENLFMYVVNRSKNRNYYWILLSRIEAKNPVFVTASRTFFFRIIFPVVESNFVKRIQNLCSWIRFHKILFCFVESCCIRSICGNISLYWNFCYGSANFHFRKLKISSLLVFLVFLFLILLKYKFLYGYFLRILHG